MSSTNTTSPPLPAPFHNTTPHPTLVTQGAEAYLFRTTFLTPDNPAALKVRPSKPYRHPTLDARLTKQRVLAEARVLAKLAGLGVAVPRLWGVDWIGGGGGSGSGSGSGGAWLMMEWIEGKSVKELLREWDLAEKERSEERRAEGEGDVKRREEEVRSLMRRVGRVVGILHSIGGVVHGDLTSSNIMMRPDLEKREEICQKEVDGSDQLPGWPSLDGEIVLIDFGLATQSIQDEDRAVDLYVLERAFGSTHPRQEAWFAEELLESADGYLGSFKGANVVLKRLEEVRLRGRKRSMLG